MTATAPSLLVSGHMGSGKSALLSVVNAPPEVVILGGLRCFNRLDVSLPRHVRGLDSQGKRADFRDVGARWGYLQYLARLGARSFPLRPVRSGDVSQVLRQVFPDAVLVGDACNAYQFQIGRNVASEQLRQVIVCRDGRDVAAEMKRRSAHGWAALAANPSPPDWYRDVSTPRRTASSWLRAIDLMEAHPEHVFVVRFEALVTDPASVLDPLAEWLGVPEIGRDAGHLDPSTVGRFRTELTPTEIADVEEVAGPVLARLGYV